jgi:hypothetical protein
MGLVGVILLEVDADGCKVMVLLALGASHLRPHRLPQLHLHGSIVLHPQPQMCRATAGVLCFLAESQGVCAVRE